MMIQKEKFSWLPSNFTSLSCINKLKFPKKKEENKNSDSEDVISTRRWIVMWSEIDVGQTCFGPHPDG